MVLMTDNVRFRQIEETHKLAQYLTEQGYDIVTSYGEKINKEAMNFNCGFSIQDPKKAEDISLFLFFHSTKNWNFGAVSVEPEGIVVKVTPEYFKEFEKILKHTGITKKINLEVSLEHPYRTLLNRKGESICGTITIV